MEGTEKNELKVYQVEISEALIRSVPVSAHSEVEAVEKVIGRYKAGQIVLAYEDFTGVGLFGEIGREKKAWQTLHLKSVDRLESLQRTIPGGREN